MQRSDSIEDMRLFQVVVECGSMSEAARVLATTPSTISRRIASLERNLGVKLLSRSTRRLTLTDAGQTLSDRGKSLILELDSLCADLTHSRREPRGTLRISASTGFGGRYIVPLLAEFRTLHPHLWVELRLEDGLADLLGRDVDVAIRVGRLTDSQLRHVTLAPLHRIFCASEAYLSAHGVPTIPSELHEHECILVVRPGYAPEPWRVHNGPALKLVPKCAVSTHEAAVTAAISGAGIAYVPYWLAAREMEAGLLKRVMPSHGSSDRSDVHLLWQDQAPAKVLAFVTFVRQRIKRHQFIPREMD